MSNRQARASVTRSKSDGKTVRDSSKVGLDKTPVEQKCPVCNKSVKDADKAVECDLCILWHHKECQKISDTLYAVMTSEENENINWYCDQCKKGAKRIMTQLVKMTERQEKLEERQNKIEREL